MFLTLSVVLGFSVFISPVHCLTDTLPTPLSELLAISPDYQHIPGINTTIVEVTSCLNRVYAESKRYSDLHDSPETRKTSIECRDPRSYRACHNMATVKLNACIPGRGDVIQKIHDALYHEFCMDGGGTIFDELSKNNGEMCTVNFHAEECVSDDAVDAWETIETCTSFMAYKRCQSTALRNCREIKLTQIIKEKIQKAEKSLSCFLEEIVCYLKSFWRFTYSVAKSTTA